MTLKITRPNADYSLKPQVEKISGVDLNACYQCKKCTSGCAVAKITRTAPSEIVRRLQLGAGTELLDSDLVWMCLSCETCFARCPMQVNVAAVIDALRKLAVEKRATRPPGDMPLFNQHFLRTVKSYGRAYDLSMIMGYKLGTLTFTRDTDKFPTMLKKGKMALLPPSGADKRLVQHIFYKARESRESEK